MKRRHFIQKSTLGLASLAYPSILLPRAKDSIGVALVGLGYYSRDLLAPALQLTRHCHLAGIVTGSPEKIPIWREKYGIKNSNVYNYENMHTIANNPEIDAIYIVTPNALHLPHVRIAAEAGKHVWCEKPLALNAAEGREIIKVCRQNKVQLTVGYRLQHEPNTRTIMGWASSRPYGKINQVVAKAGWTSRGGNHWKLRKELGGGAIYDMGTYPLNAVRYCTGEEPISVSARHITHRPEIFFEVDETTEFTLRFKSGLVAHCTTSLGQSINRLDVNCDKGSYSLEPFQAYNGVGGKASDGTLLDTYLPNQQAKQMDDDALAIIRGEDPLVPGEDGLRDMEIIDGIFASAAAGGKEVAV